MICKSNNNSYHDSRSVFFQCFFQKRLAPKCHWVIRSCFSCLAWMGRISVLVSCLMIMFEHPETYMTLIYWVKLMWPHVFSFTVRMSICSTALKDIWNWSFKSTWCSLPAATQQLRSSYVQLFLNWFEFNSFGSVDVVLYLQFNS